MEGRPRARAIPFPAGRASTTLRSRYARAFRRLLGRAEQVTLVVCHEIPIRYALNGAAGSADLDAPEHQVPNATPYLFGETSLERAVGQIDRVIR